MDSQSLTSLAPISAFIHTQESKPTKTEYRIRILNLNLNFKLNANTSPNTNSPEFSESQSSSLRNCDPWKKKPINNTDAPDGEYLCSLLKLFPRRIFRNSEANIKTLEIAMPHESLERQDQLQRVSRLRIFQIYFILNKFKVKLQRNHDTVCQAISDTSFYPPSFPFALSQIFLGRFFGTINH